ncbi:hypothetical protein B0H11DRAFT_1989739 [Mycena galericulata]|nr:hypothetical protein B0H11DRAFT_1989739 [Mycena galericulata]
MAELPAESNLGSVEMHRSLHIPEIVTEICSHLDPSPGVESADLAALARTCQIFQDIALDALWKSQDTIVNLIMCMPNDLWEILNPLPLPLMMFQISPGRRVRPTRPVVESDWDRVLKYSHRVQRLRCFDDDKFNVFSVFETLRLGVPGGYLLPNLRAIMWDYSNSVALPFLDLFLSPRITAIGLGQCSDNAHYSLLANLALKYPRLSTVAIGPLDPDEDYDDEDDEDVGDGNPRPRATDAQLCTFVRALTDVQALSVGTLDLAALSYLGSITTLRELIAKLPDSISFSGVRERSLFSHLSFFKLGITCGNILALTDLVRTWNNPRLESFEAHFINDYAGISNRSMVPQRIENLHGVLSAHCVPASLETFKFDLTTDNHSGVGTFVYPGYLFSSLFCFNNLVTVSISVGEGFDIDDTVVSDLAHAWPCLRELRLTTDISAKHRHQPCVTLLGLHSLAQHCPHLHTLEMTFDANSVPSPEADPEARIIQQSLVTLYTSFSSISSPIPVAQFLLDTFVNLKNVYASYATPYEAQWEEVETYIGNLTEIREEERSIASASAAVDVDE